MIQKLINDRIEILKNIDNVPNGIYKDKLIERLEILNEFEYFTEDEIIKILFDVFDEHILRNPNKNYFLETFAQKLI